MSAILKSMTGICPKCGVIRNFSVNVEHQQHRQPDGTEQEIETLTTHCETCSSFVSRESREITGKKS
jgi:hypothetical protein